MEPNNPLSYESPAAVDDFDVSWHGKQVVIDIGPMPARVFVVAFLPVAALLTGITGLGLLFGVTAEKAGTSICGFLVAAACVWIFFMMIRQRAVPRRVWASPDRLGFSNFKAPVAADIPEQPSTNRSRLNAAGPPRGRFGSSRHRPPAPSICTTANP
jgi:hypothetical protein